MDCYGDRDADVNEPYDFSINVEPETTLNSYADHKGNLYKHFIADVKYELVNESSSFQFLIFHSRLSKNIPVFMTGEACFIDELTEFKVTFQRIKTENETVQIMMQRDEYRLHVYSYLPFSPKIKNFPYVTESN